MKKISDGISIAGLGLYFDSCLIISDVHIGYEESVNMKGLLIPRIQFAEIIKSLDKIFLEFPSLKKIIINGDLKHEFGKISQIEWRHTLRLLDYLSKKCDEIILIRGNHDKILGPIAQKRNVKIKDHYIIRDKMIIHGDIIPEKFEQILRKNKIKNIIIGHEHPAISLKQGARIEKFKCFLKGRWKKYDLIAMPSFNPIIEGTDISTAELLSPYLQQDLNNFSVFIVGDKIYDFGKLKNLL